MLHACKYLSLGVTCIGCRGLDRCPCHVSDCVKAIKYDLSLIHLAGRNLHVENYTAGIIYYRVLLVGWFKPAIAPVGSHGSVRVSGTNLLVFAGFTTISFSISVFVSDGDSIHMANCDALPAHIRTDEGIYMYNLTVGDLGCRADFYRSLKNLTKAVGTPTLTDSGQR